MANVLRKILTGAAIVILTAPGVQAKDRDRDNFKNGDLNFGYVFRVRGFQQNETSAPFHSGELTALGLIHFDGNGGVKDGGISFTVADNGGGAALGDQANCTAQIDPAKSSYSIQPNGTGTLTLSFQLAPACVAAASGEGHLVFTVVIDSDNTKNASVSLTSFSSGLVVGGEPIDTLAADGGLTKRHQ